MDRIDKVRAVIESGGYVPMTRGELMTFMGAPKEDKDEFCAILDALAREGVIVETKGRRFMSVKKSGFIKGIYRGTGKGYGFFEAEGNPALFVPPDGVNGAMDGDEVLALKTASGHGERNGEAEIARILKRARKRLVGTYRRENYCGMVRPDSKKIDGEILIADEDSLGALDGQKVVVEIEKFATKSQYAVGRVLEILGFPTDLGVDVMSVVKGYGFDTKFPQEVLNEADALPDEVTDVSGRLDLTDETIFTIDGKDTKDIDDAVSIEKRGDMWRLGVHIADVSNYVKPFSKLDSEARTRGTSVYPADMVIPMLPTKLSNGICSLNEGVLRCAVSVFMDIDASGEVRDYFIAESVIKSSAKTTYDDIYLLMTGEADEGLKERYGELIPSVREMAQLYKVLKKASDKRGNVDFDTPEAKITVDENGEVVSIEKRERNDAHRMIEEFMVITNSTVARHMVKNEFPAVFRTHDAPDGEKLEAFKTFLLTLGINPPTGELTPTRLREFLDSIKDRKEFPIVSMAALRSMQKAKYMAENRGHYGLALAFYTHFTSPIRRYPDLFFHRALKASLKNDKKTLAYIAHEGKSAAETSSEREIAAERCERDVEDIKKAQFMAKHIGETFEGIISSVTRFGFFVALENTVEGLVRVENLSGDRYEFDEKALALRGARKGEVFKIGMEAKVKLIAVNAEMGQIDFIPEGMEYGEGKNNSAEQKSVPRVFHRGKNRGGHRTVRHGGKKRPHGKGKS